ncbi:MAG: tyrosine recombinase [Terriglobia bacterium]|nr:tyrosine recombinase [Terriglobia bacterium]
MIPRPARPSATLGAEAEEFLTWLAVEQGRAPNTIAAYRRDLVDFECYLKDAGGAHQRSDSRMVENYLARRRSEGLAPASLARILATLRGFYRFRMDEGSGSNDPTAGVRRPPIPDRLPKALTEDQIDLLLQATAGPSGVDRRDRALLEVLYGTGIRVGELVGLSLGDVEHDTGLLRVLGKGAKERLVPLGRCARAALDEWLDVGGRPQMEPERWARRGDAEAVFLNQRGGRLTRQGVSLVVAGRARRAGLPRSLHPHVLRHSCATHMLAHGADIRVVQELLGHASIATTQVYTRVSMEHLRTVYESAHPRARPRTA